MKTSRKLAVITLLVLAQGSLLMAGEAEARKAYYAIEINGVVCGYNEVSESRLSRDGGDYISSEADIFVMLSLLGSQFNSQVRVRALLDAATRRARSVTTTIDQGGNRMEFGMTVDKGEAVLASPRRSEPLRVPVGPDVLIGSDELMLRLRREFLAGKAATASYDILEVLEEEVQRSDFRRLREEAIELAGRTFQAVVVEGTNAKTGVKTTFWLAPEHDGFVKFTVRDRSVYLADRRVVDRIKVADMDASFFTKVNTAISDVTAISYMKLKVKIAPTGVSLKAADLSVPGQAFSGTVSDNVIDGVLEIEHARYDGKNALAFPPPSQDDPALKRYLRPERFIESDDPVLAARAREITAGAADSWQAATRLSRWVADHIAYAIPGGGSARGAYDMRAGECGAHSMLLAAFCRAVGIPARVVFGAMYAPNFGGGFGQHAWNELYMGAAGWIPVDATAFETDFVDSGHIRIAEVVSIASTAFNAREIAVLDHRLARASAAAGSPDFTPFLGRFAHPQGSRTFSILEREGNLALDIPGRMVLPFAAPDEKGRWICKFAPHVYVTFAMDEQGRAASMELHEVVPIPRQGVAEAAPAGVPADLAPYVGAYLLAAAKAEFKVTAQAGGLALYDALEKKTVTLKPAGEEGAWRYEDGPNTVRFEREGQGRATLMRLDIADRFERGELAATLVEEAMSAQGLEAGMKRFAALRAEGRRGVFFNEGSFNALGYRLQEAGKMEEAIAVFQLNAREYPASANAYDSLGEAYMKSGRNDLAIENYRKALELDPRNENVRKMLEKLEAH